MTYTRPTRGVLRLDQFKFDPNALRQDVDKFSETDWKVRAYGTEWADIMLVKDGKEHPIFKDCTYIQDVLKSFKGEVIDAVLARLGPGGVIGVHRDFSGGTPLGVARFHIPITTDPGVEFYVNDMKLYLAPGEVWNLDTSYPHALNNKSQVTRIHLIVDLRFNDHLRSLLPKEDFVDKLHKLHFAGLCLSKGLVELVVSPQKLFGRIKGMFRILVLKKSSL